MPIPEDQRNLVKKAAPGFLRAGLPVKWIATHFGIKPRTVYDWLQNDPAAYSARLQAIESGVRFARGLSDKQITFRRQMALRRLSMHRKETGIELRKPRRREAYSAPVVRGEECQLTVTPPLGTE